MSAGAWRAAVRAAALRARSVFFVLFLFFFVRGQGWKKKEGKKKKKKKNVDDESHGHEKKKEKKASFSIFSLALVTFFSHSNTQRTFEQPRVGSVRDDAPRRLALCACHFFSRFFSFPMLSFFFLV